MSFEQAARNLAEVIHSDQVEAIEQFLLVFTEHILWNTTPASGSTIKQYRGLLIGEIARAIEDMTPGQSLGIEPYPNRRERAVNPTDPDGC